MAELIYVDVNPKGKDYFGLTITFEATDIGESWTDEMKFESSPELMDFVFSIMVTDNVYDIGVSAEKFEYTDMPSLPHKDVIELLIEKGELFEELGKKILYCLDNAYYSAGSMTMHHVVGNSKKECIIKFDDRDKARSREFARKIIDAYDECE